MAKERLEVRVSVEKDGHDLTIYPLGNSSMVEDGFILTKDDIEKVESALDDAKRYLDAHEGGSE